MLPVADLLPVARRNVSEILRFAIAPSSPTALLVYDRDSPLSALLSRAWREALPAALALDFSETLPGAVLSAAEALPAASLVVLIQSSSFQLAAHRFRVRLFERGLAVVEHRHLARIAPAEEATYVDALAYDPLYYRGLGGALLSRLRRAGQVRLSGEQGDLVYEGPFEDPIGNLGDYRGHANVGGQFPIGEVFTELRDLEAVSGRVRLFAYGDPGFNVVAPDEPFLLVVERGAVTAAAGAPAEFERILEDIRAAEGKVLLRELGFGLNRAMSRNRRVTDIGAYERMCGIHVSLGAKHAMFSKPGLSRRQRKFHVDVFPDVDRVEIDAETVFSGGAYGMLS